MVAFFVGLDFEIREMIGRQLLARARSVRPAISPAMASADFRYFDLDIIAPRSMF
jgi:hypothetical protein